MDYLVIGGYKTAAELFAREAGVSPPVDLQSIESRMCIREALQRGDVQDAITRVNDLNPEVCVFYAITIERIIPCMHHAEALGPVRIMLTKTSVFNMIFSFVLLSLSLMLT